MTGKTSGPKDEKDPVKRELSSKVFPKPPSLLLQQGNEPILYFFCLGLQRKPKEVPCRTVQLSWESLQPCFCSRSGRP